MNCQRIISCITLPSTSLPPSLPLAFWRAEAWPQYFTIFQCPQILEFRIFLMYGVPPSPGISGISSTRSIVIAWVQNLCNVFLPQKFCSSCRFPAYAKGIFRGSSVLEFRTQSRNEQAQMELRWELPVDFWFCGTGSGADFPERRCPFFPVQTIHAKSTPPQKS